MDVANLMRFGKSTDKNCVSCYAIDTTNGAIVCECEVWFYSE